jgi:hypothetical protein
VFETLSVYSVVGLAIVVRKQLSIRTSSTSTSRPFGRYAESEYAKHRICAAIALYNRLRIPLDLWRKRIDYSVDGPSRALHRAVRYVLRGNRGALRHIPRCAHRPRLNADAGNGEGEND